MEIKLSENAKLITQLQNEAENVQNELLQANNVVNTSVSDISVKHNQVHYNPVDKLFTRIEQKDTHISELQRDCDGLKDKLSELAQRNAVLETENLNLTQF